MNKQCNFKHEPNPDSLKYDDRCNLVYSTCVKCGEKICETELALIVKVNAWRVVEENQSES